MSAATAQWTSLEAAMAQFLSAGRNEEILLGALGRLDCATSHMFDALEYDGRPARTWREAFAACAGGRTVGGTRSSVKDGKHRITRVSRIVRSWATFDLAALRGLDPALEGLEYPLEVYEAQADAALAEWHRTDLEACEGYRDAAQAAWYLDGGGCDDEDAVPSWDADELAAAMMGGDEGEIVVDEEMIIEEVDGPWVWRAVA